LIDQSEKLAAIRGEIAATIAIDPISEVATHPVI
jgi:hypothetical protein